MFFQAEDIRGNGLVSKSLTEISQSFTQQQAVSVKHCTGNSVLPQRAIILHRASANPFHRKQCSPIHLQTMNGTPAASAGIMSWRATFVESNHRKKTYLKVTRKHYLHFLF